MFIAGHRFNSLRGEGNTNGHNATFPAFKLFKGTIVKTTTLTQAKSLIIKSQQRH
jgi:hypothetical protein